MFTIDKTTQITPLYLSQVIQQFETMEKPKLQRYFNYYLGKQAILNKVVKDQSKPCNRIVVNFPKYIVDSYAGYLTGIDVTYSSPEDIESLQWILNYNDVADEDSQLLKNALIYGVGYEQVWIDEDNQQRFKVIDSREVIPIYFNTIEEEIAGIIRYYKTNSLTEEYYCELYLPDTTFTYKTNSGFSSFQLIKEEENFYHQVPITVFPLNDERMSIFDNVMGLTDAYNKLLSSETDDWEAFCDAYLCLYGMDATSDEIRKMKENRVLVIPDGGKAEYLTKNVADTQIENMLNNIEQKIHKISSCPDFSSEAFGTSSGIAMKMKLLGFENSAGIIEKAMTKALQRRIELLNAILSLSGEENLWTNIQIKFTRNLPVDTSEITQEVNSLRGLVSDKTLLSQIPFIDDVESEMEAIEKQNKTNASLYQFRVDEDGE